MVPRALEKPSEGGGVMARAKKMPVATASQTPTTDVSDDDALSPEEIAILSATLDPFVESDTSWIVPHGIEVIALEVEVLSSALEWDGSTVNQASAAHVLRGIEKRLQMLFRLAKQQRRATFAGRAAP